MRSARLLVVLALLGACGGADDAPEEAAAREPAAEARTVTSDDGLADLALPAGAPADVTVTAIDAGDGLRAYRLEPSGTTFDEAPARLTVRDVDSGERGAVVAAWLVDDGDGVPIGAEIDYGESGSVATVAVELPHFSDLVLRKGSGTVTFDAPDRVAVGQPFAATATATWTDATVPGRGDVPVTVEEVSFAAALTAERLTPANVDDAPPPTALRRGASQSFPSTFTCPQRGNAYVRMSANYSENRYSGPQSAMEYSAIAYLIFLVEGMACDTAPASPTVNAIGAKLEVPVTTYYVEATAPRGARLVYEWRMAGEACGSPKVPFDRRDDSGLGFGSSIDWSHADTPPDSCNHASPDHDVTVSVTVAVSGGGSVTCVLQGSETKRVEKPPCS